MNVKRQFYIFVVKLALFHIYAVLVDPCMLYLDTLLIYVLLMLRLHTPRASDCLSNINIATLASKSTTNLLKSVNLLQAVYPSS